MRFQVPPRAPPPAISAEADEYKVSEDFRAFPFRCVLKFGNDSVNRWPAFANAPALNMATAQKKLRNNCELENRRAVHCDLKAFSLRLRRLRRVLGRRFFD